METWQRIELGGGSRMVQVRRYRVMSFRKPLAPWRATLEEAEWDALDLRVGTLHGRVVYMTVPAWIWEVDPSPVTEKGLKTRRRRHLAPRR